MMTFLQGSLVTFILFQALLRGGGGEAYERGGLI